MELQFVNHEEQWLLLIRRSASRNIALIKECHTILSFDL
jgi:hypothetical protein